MDQLIKEQRLRLEALELLVKSQRQALDKQQAETVALIKPIHDKVINYYRSIK